MNTFTAHQIADHWIVRGGQLGGVAVVVQHSHQTMFKLVFGEWASTRDVVVDEQVTELGGEVIGHEVAVGVDRDFNRDTKPIHETFYKSLLAWTKNTNLAEQAVEEAHARILGRLPEQVGVCEVTCVS